jgi:hypothetical protein
MVYTDADIEVLRRDSKARTPIVQVAKLMKRSLGSSRSAAGRVFSFGHRRTMSQKGKGSDVHREIAASMNL